MEQYDYLEAVTEDVKEWIRENPDSIKDMDREEAENFLHDALWTVDSVTGNGSGSYTFSTWEAEENICHNSELIEEVCDEFGEVPDMSKGAEFWDVSIRCYLLGQAIAEALDSLGIE